jgi:hypothetical protein
VKILLDESVPRLLKLRLTQLNISTVHEIGWAGIQNGELLRRADELFEVFITADQSLRYQQDLSRCKLAIPAETVSNLRLAAGSLVSSSH